MWFHQKTLSLTFLCPFQPLCSEWLQKIDSSHSSLSGRCFYLTGRWTMSIIDHNTLRLSTGENLKIRCFKSFWRCYFVWKVLYLILLVLHRSQRQLLHCNSLNWQFKNWFFEKFLKLLFCEISFMLNFVTTPLTTAIVALQTLELAL